MSRRNDRSMLLVLSQEEGSALKSIIDLKPAGTRRVSGSKRVMIGIAAAVLIALIATGVVQPEQVHTLIELAGLLLAF